MRNKTAATASKTNPTIATGVRLLRRPTTMTMAATTTTIAGRYLAIWEMPLAIVIMLASIYGMARLAGRIYATGLVSGGARLSWMVALRLR